MRILILIAISSTLCAEDAQAPQTRTVPAVLYGEVYRARGQLLEAKQAYDLAISAVADFCGEKYTVSIDLSDSKKNVCILKTDAH